MRHRAPGRTSGVPEKSEAGDTTSNRRLDIEGLRAVAVGSVLAYHGAERLVPGGFIGVDVFFVISGFLITSLLVREVEASGRVRLARFWSRRAKRLLPAAAVVLVFSSVVMWLVGPVTQRRVFGGDIVASAGYFVNFRLAARSVDYLAEGVAVSPVQHYWSLSVEEQFYVVWPLLVLVGGYLARRATSRVRRLLFVVIGVTSLASLAISINMTASNRGAAFFATQTRIWELGIGALVALAATRLAQLPRWMREVLAGGGLLAIGSSLWLFSDSSSWPSYRPLLPCVGAAAVIVAGLRGPKTMVGRLLSIRPMVWVGGLSYSIYLWHWPFLIAATSLWGELGIKRSALVLAVSLVPAWVVHKLIENPIRYSREMSSRPSLALSIGGNCSFLAAGAGLALCLAVPGGTPASSATRDVLGAAVIEDDGSNWPELLAVEESETIYPPPLEAVDDLPKSYRHPCEAKEPGTPPVCVVGDPDGKLRIATVGDSMMQQWEPALDIIGKEHGIRFEEYHKSSCQFSPSYTAWSNEDIVECHEHGRMVLDHLISSRPDLVIQSGNQDAALARSDDPNESASTDVLSNGFHTYWSKLAEHGIPLAFILRNPEVVPVTDDLDRERLYDCVQTNPKKLTACVGEAKYKTPKIQREIVESATVHVELIDVNRYVCGNKRCPAVIGGALVYRQGIHMTRTYVESLAPRLADEILRVLDSFQVNNE